MGAPKLFWKQATRAPFAAGLALLALLTGIRGMIDPASLPIHVVVGDWSYLWAVMYGLGGAFMLYGAGTASPRWEAMGAIWFSTGAGLQALAILAFPGSSPFVNFWGAVNLAIFSVAGILRARHLVKGQTLIWVEGRYNGS